jgi:hypothetical protein
MKKYVKNLYPLLHGKNRKVAWRGVPSVVGIFTLLLFMASECKKEEKDIIGSWKLTRLEYPLDHFDGEPYTVVDYSDSNIVFTFKTNNTLLISGNMAEGCLPAGEYIYTYKKMIKGSQRGKPGHNLIIDNKSFWGEIQEKKTQLSIIEADRKWGINLIK